MLLQQQQHVQAHQGRLPKAFLASVQVQIIPSGILCRAILEALNGLYAMMTTDQLA